jgi:hypothetical protein
MRNLNTFPKLAVYALSFAASAHAADSPAPAAQGIDAQLRADFGAGFGGDKARMDAAMKRCGAILAEQPTNAEALAWHGSATLYQAGQAYRTGDFAVGADLFDRGEAEMDRAAGLAPDNIAVRTIRGATYLNASRQMPGGPAADALLKLGLGDFEKAYAGQKDHFEMLPARARDQLLFGLGDGYLRSGDAAKARPWFEKLAADKDAEHNPQAQQFLATGTLTPPAK